MIVMALLSLAAGGVLLALGGPVGWVFGAVYVLLGADLLWFEIQLSRLRKRHALRK